MADETLEKITSEWTISHSNTEAEQQRRRDVKRFIREDWPELALLLDELSRDVVFGKPSRLAQSLALLREAEEMLSQTAGEGGKLSLLDRIAAFLRGEGK